MKRILRSVGIPIMDSRGQIRPLIDFPVRIRSILLITSKAGSIRANHYHKKDTHYVYLLSGLMEYTERNMNTKSAKRAYLIQPGDVVLSPPMYAHAMRFLEDSVFFAFTTEKREQESYERDTVRLPLIQP